MFAKTFRNSLLASSLLIGTSLLVGPAAMADESGPTNVSSGSSSGEIEVISTIEFTPNANGEINRAVSSPNYDLGTLAVTNNNYHGWILEVASANGGQLVIEGGGHEIEYTAVTTGGIGASEATARTLANANTEYQLHDFGFDSEVANGVTGVPVTATLGNTQNVPAGVYSDTLTFTLTSKDAPD